MYFFPRGIRKFYLDGINPVLELSLGVQNTSNQSFTINSLAGDLYLSNTYLGNVSLFSPAIIRPNSETLITVKARLVLVAAAVNLYNAFKSKTFKGSLVMDSTANIDRLQVPVDISYTI